MKENCEIIVERIELGYDERFVVRRSDKSKKIYLPDPEKMLAVYIISAKNESDSHEDMAEAFVETNKDISENLYAEYEAFKKKEHNNSFKDFLTWKYSALTVAGKGALEEPEMVCADDDTKVIKKIIKEYLLLGYKMKAPKSAMLGGNYGRG